MMEKWRKDKRHEPLPKRPERCDPADPVPVASHVGDAPMLSIDERIREVVRELVSETPAETPDPSLEDLARIEALADHEDVAPLSPHMLVDMEADSVPERDIDSFIAGLSETELADLRELIAVQDEVTAEAAPGSETETSSRA